MSGKHTKKTDTVGTYRIIIVLLTALLALMVCLYFFNPRVVEIESTPDVIIADRSAAQKQVYVFSPNTSIKYLEMDGAAFRPAAPLTHGEMVKMIYALLGTNKVGTATFTDVTEDMDCYKAACTLKTLGIVTGSRLHPDEPVTFDELKEVLSYFSQTIKGGEEDVTRRDAVEIMGKILKRDVPENFEDIGTIVDVSKDDKDFYLIADAALTETLPVLESGYYFTGHTLRLIDENGNVVANKTVDGFMFDANGKQTSGSAELDALIQDVLEKVLVDTPEHKFHDQDGNLILNDEAALKAVYKYVTENSKYVPRNFYDVGDTSWAADEATVMLKTLRGNCYNFASAFYELARAIGFPAQLYSGTMGEEDDPHSWVEIFMDGEDKLFDPEVEYTKNSWDFVSYFKRSQEFAHKFDYKKE